MVEGGGDGFEGDAGGRGVGMIRSRSDVVAFGG